MAKKQAPQKYADGGPVQPGQQGQPALSIAYADGGSLDNGGPNGKGPYTGNLDSKTTLFNQDYLRGANFGSPSYAGLVSYPAPAPVAVSPNAASAPAPQQIGGNGARSGIANQPMGAQANMNMIGMDAGLQAQHQKASQDVLGAFTGAMLGQPMTQVANLALSATGKPTIPNPFDAIKSTYDEAQAINDYATANPDKAIQAGYLPGQYLNFSDLFNGLTVGERAANVQNFRDQSQQMAQQQYDNLPTGEENMQALEGAVRDAPPPPAPEVNPQAAAASLSGMEAEPGWGGNTSPSGGYVSSPGQDQGTTGAMQGGFGDTKSSSGEADGGLQMPTGVAQASGNFLPNQQAAPAGLSMPQQGATAPADPMHPSIAALHVQNTLANPQALALIKQHIQMAVDSGKVNPQQLTIMGQLAQAAMQHPEIWPKLRQFAIQAGVAGPNDLPQQFNQGLCMLLVTVAQAAQHGDQPGAMANGGVVRGPGTGISDSIPAHNQDTGQHIKLSNGEYVIPADVVATKGKEFFDNIVRKYHTPAALQRRQ